MNTTVVIKAEYAFLIQPFVSTDKLRPYINGFHIAKPFEGQTGCYIVATDNHQMGVFHDADAIIEGTSQETVITLPKDTIRQCKNRKESRYLVIYENKAHVVSAEDHESALQAVKDNRMINIKTIQPNCFIDCTYPNWTRVIPKTKDIMPCNQAINAKYVQNFGKCSKQKTPAVMLHATGPGNPLLITTDRRDFIGVLMPVRFDDSIPEFLGNLI